MYPVTTAPGAEQTTQEEWKVTTAFLQQINCVFWVVCIPASAYVNISI